MNVPPFPWCSWFTFQVRCVCTRYETLPLDEIGKFVHLMPWFGKEYNYTTKKLMLSFQSFLLRQKCTKWRKVHSCFDPRWFLFNHLHSGKILRSYAMLKSLPVFIRRVQHLSYLWNSIGLPILCLQGRKWRYNLQPRFIKSTHGSNTRTFMQFLLPTANARFEFESNLRPTLSAAANRKPLCFNADEIAEISFF